MDNSAHGSIQNSSGKCYDLTPWCASSLGELREQTDQLPFILKGRLGGWPRFRRRRAALRVPPVPRIWGPGIPRISTDGKAGRFSGSVPQTGLRSTGIRRRDMMKAAGTNRDESAHDKKS